MVGKSLDLATDGVRLGLGKCFDCLNCSPGSLRAAKVAGQGASNGYSVIQFQQ
jgi:hypothetical protein